MTKIKLKLFTMNLKFIFWVMLIFLIEVQVTRGWSIKDESEDEDLLQQEKNKVKSEMETLFKKIDLNQDNKIDRDELYSDFVISMRHWHDQRSVADFLKIDKDGNKKMSWEEYENYIISEEEKKPSGTGKESKESLLKKINGHLKNRFKAAENNNDGYLNIFEYQYFKYPIFFNHMAGALSPEIHNKHDEDNDGKLNFEEYLNTVEEINLLRFEEKYEVSLDDEEKIFNYADYDGNKLITVYEFEHLMKPGYVYPAEFRRNFYFEQSDGNKDDILTLEEMMTNSSLWLTSILVYPKVLDPYSHRLADEL